MAKENQRIMITLSSLGNGILMNPMTNDTLEQLAGIQGKAASDKDQPAEVRAAKKVIRRDGKEDGEIGLPVEYFFGCLNHAGRDVKNGKKQISTAQTTTVFQFLTIEGGFFPFTNQNEQMIVDIRRGVSNNAGKTAAVAIIRPRFAKWEVKMTITLNTVLCSAAVLKQLFETAGSKIGVGDFRPTKKGPFGMFAVTGWDELKD